MFLLNFVKSVFFNFRYLPFKQAIYMPVWITTNLKECKLKRGQLILKRPYRKSVFIGSGGSPALQHFYSGLMISEGGKLILNGLTVFSEGSVIRCDKDAIIEIGKDFYCNKNCFIRSTNHLIIGNNCLLGWNVQILTTDGHSIMYDNHQCEKDKYVRIGNHVWVASNSYIQKDVDIADDCVIAQGAIITKSFSEPKCLIGGIPAKIIKKGITWK